MVRKSYFSPPPAGRLSQLFGYWRRQHHIYAKKMRARLQRMIKTGAIEISPPLPRGWQLRDGDYAIKTSTADGWWAAEGWTYRIIRPSRVLRPAKAAPVPLAAPQEPDSPAAPEKKAVPEKKAPPGKKAAPEKKNPQQELAWDYMKTNYPNDTWRGVSATLIRKKLAKDPKLLAEIEAGLIREVPSITTINRVKRQH